MALTGRETHPLIPLLTSEEEACWPVEEITQFYDLRRQAIGQTLADPLRYGYEPAIWLKADEAIGSLRRRFPTGVLLELDLGGNRASKTERRAKRLVQNLARTVGWKAWALQSNQTSSRQNQQSVIYKYLPPEWKPASGKLRGGPVTKIVYSQAGGFTEDVLVCPNGSECRFKFYGMDVGGVEGAELDEAWGDELITLDWIEALIFRLVTRNGTLGITFTPIEGYSATVKAILDGAATVEEVVAELLPIMRPVAERSEVGSRKSEVGDQKSDIRHLTSDLSSAGGLERIGYEMVPRVQENLNALINGQRTKAAVVYFHTKDNPFGNYPSMRETLEGASREKILIRAYGVPTKATGSKFPIFNDLAHVVSLNRFREIQKAGGTWYQFLDPCSARNWFSTWVFADCTGRYFVAGETPSHSHEWAYIPGVGDPGPWALPSSSQKRKDGEPGEGQQEWGWGYTRYFEEFERMEGLLALEDGGRIPIFERWIDARYGTARKTNEEESSTLIRDLEKLDWKYLAAPSERGVLDSVHGGGSAVRMINDHLYYDRATPIDFTNQPKLYLVETCPNVIYAVKNWTGEDGQHGATKDPIDTLRMLVLSGVKYIDEAKLAPRQPWLQQFKN